LQSREDKLFFEPDLAEAFRELTENVDCCFFDFNAEKKVVRKKASEVLV
jgi:hypothetical protein